MWRRTTGAQARGDQDGLAHAQLAYGLHTGLRKITKQKATARVAFTPKSGII